MRAVAAMLKASALSTVRDARTLAETVAFPSILVVAFGIFELDIDDGGFGAGAAAIDYLDFALAGILTLTAVQLSVHWTAVAYAGMRQSGVLRRLRATPMPFASFVLAQVLTRLLVVTVQASVVTLVATALGADIVGNAALLVAATLIGAATFLSLGFAIGALASDAASADVTAALIVMPPVFLSGAFFPVAGLPDWLRAVMETLPLVPLLDALRSIIVEGGRLPDVADELARVLAWLPPAVALAALVTRGRPRRRRFP